MGSPAEFLSIFGPLAGLLVLFYAWMVHQSICEVRVGNVRLLDSSAAVHRRVQEIVRPSLRILAMVLGLAVVLVAGIWAWRVAAGIATGGVMAVLAHQLTTRHIARSEVRAAFLATEPDEGASQSIASAAGGVLALVPAGLSVLGTSIPFVALITLADNAGLSMPGRSALVLGVVVGMGFGACLSALLVRATEDQAGAGESLAERHATAGATAGILTAASRSSELVASWMLVVAIAMAAALSVPKSELMSSEVTTKKPAGEPSVDPTPAASAGTRSIPRAALPLILSMVTGLGLVYLGRTRRQGTAKSSSASPRNALVRAIALYLGVSSLLCLVLVPSAWQGALAHGLGVLAAVILGALFEVNASGAYLGIQAVADSARLGLWKALAAGMTQSLGAASGSLVVLALLLGICPGGAFGLAMASLGVVAGVAFAMSAASTASVLDCARARAVDVSLPEGAEDRLRRASETASAATVSRDGVAVAASLLAVASGLRLIGEINPQPVEAANALPALLAGSAAVLALGGSSLLAATLGGRGSRAWVWISLVSVGIVALVRPTGYAAMALALEGGVVAAGVLALTALAAGAAWQKSRDLIGDGFGNGGESEALRISAMSGQLGFALRRGLTEQVPQVLRCIAAILLLLAISRQV